MSDYIECAEGLMEQYVKKKDVLALETDLHFENIEQLKHYRVHHIDPSEVILLPAADVRPVVHGEWIRIDYKPHGHDYQCTVCQFKNDEPNNFCPNCGADMREEI